MFDWDREVVTCDPEYYHWTQWFFIQFFKPAWPTASTRRSTGAPTCNTTLAREQVVGDDRAASAAARR